MIRLSPAIRVSTMARIWSAGKRVGSDSRARVANDLLPTRSRLVSSFSAIDSHRIASALEVFPAPFMKNGCSILGVVFQQSSSSIWKEENEVKKKKINPSIFAYNANNIYMIETCQDVYLTTCVVSKAKNHSVIIKVLFFSIIICFFHPVIIQGLILVNF